jgi:HPt (histidine-containing phosphotransfer) domain-containing protein
MEEPEHSLSTKSGGFDAAAMLNNFMNNEKAVLPLLAFFMERTQKQITSFPVLKNAGDWETIKRDAHMIRGSALTMGGEELGMAAARLEGDRHDFDTAYPVLCKAFDSYKQEAEAFLQTRS